MMKPPNFSGGMDICPDCIQVKRKVINTAKNVVCASEVSTSMTEVFVYAIAIKAAGTSNKLDG
jgi:hypothetical protein